MSVTKLNTYEIGVNNDLENAMLNIDVNRIGTDLTVLEDDGGTFKVIVGSLIEAEGSVYVVDTGSETPTGTQEPEAYLFFDPSVPGFVWSTTRGAWDGTRAGWYDGSDRRMCHFYLTDASEDTPDERWNLLNNGPPGTIERLTYNIGEWNMDADQSSTLDISPFVLADIRGWMVLIIGDNGSLADLQHCNIDAGLMWCEAVVLAASSNFRMQRTPVTIASPSFDGTNYDATGVNRGHVFLDVVFE